MAGLRRKVALRTAALLLAVRWYNIAFLTVAQSVYIWKLVQYRPDAWTAYGSWGLTALVLAINAVLIAGGSLINNFYDTEHDLIHRPWRTLFERTVVLKYGIPLAFAFWIIGLGLAWGLGSRMGLFFAVYALLLWIYSHKRKTLGRGAHAVAAHGERIGLSASGVTLGQSGFADGLVIHLGGDINFDIFPGHSGVAGDGDVGSGDAIDEGFSCFV